MIVTKEQCLASARKFQTRTAWMNDPHEGRWLQHARARGWYEDCCAHMTSPYIRHTLEACQRSALGFKTRRQWQIHPIEGRYYQAALRYGWLNQCCAHMNRSYAVAESFSVYALFFENRRAYVGVTRDVPRRWHLHRKRFGTWIRAIVLARGLRPEPAAQAEEAWIQRLGRHHSLLNKMRGGSTGPGPRFTQNQCIDRARSFTSRVAWKRQDNSAYQTARRYGWLEQCCAHMRRPHCKYALEDCRAAARRYPSKSAWWRSIDGHLYQVARVHGWLGQCPVGS